MSTNEMGRVKTTIETYSGLFFDYADPRACDVLFADVAQALSNQCRFNGLISGFYSIAEHACLVRELVIEAGYPELGYAALHHDDEETYLGDQLKPLKPFLGPKYDQLVQRVNAAVGEALGIDPELFKHPEIKAADRLALRIEANALKPSRGLDQEYGLGGVVPDLPEGWSIQCLTPPEAWREFVYAHGQEINDR